MTSETKPAAMCECGAEIKGNGGAIAAHLRGKAHAEAMGKRLAAKLAESKPVMVCGESATITETEGGGAVVEVGGIAVGGNTPERAMSAAREAIGLATPIGDDGQPFETAGKIARQVMGRKETDSERVGDVNKVLWNGRPGDGMIVPGIDATAGIPVDALLAQEEAEKRAVRAESSRKAATERNPWTKKHKHCTNGGYMRKATDVRRARGSNAPIRDYIAKHVG